MRVPSLARKAPGAILLTGVLTALAAVSVARPEASRADTNVLRIGTSGSLGMGKGAKGKAALESLQAFIKTETGMTSEIVKQKDWRELAQMMEKGELPVGVFQGTEYAWAQEKHPSLKPLGLAVNVVRYPTVYVVTLKANPAKDFADLQGQSIETPDNGEDFVTMYLDKQAQAVGKKSSGFFSKMSQKESPEDVLDDVVDGVVQAAAVDRAALEAYKRRKPGRFAQLKPIAHSEPFPPPVVVYKQGALDEATLQRFRRGLFNAARTERGQMMLTLFHLTAFDPVPADFNQVLQTTRKEYPPPAPGGK